jgi:hypothetical protein
MMDFRSNEADRIARVPVWPLAPDIVLPAIDVLSPRWSRLRGELELRNGLHKTL